MGHNSILFSFSSKDGGVDGWSREFSYDEGVGGEEPKFPPFIVRRSAALTGTARMKARSHLELDHSRPALSERPRLSYGALEMDREGPCGRGTAQASSLVFFEFSSSAPP